jgi:hypothetical protein
MEYSYSYLPLKLVLPVISHIPPSLLLKKVFFKSKSRRNPEQNPKKTYGIFAVNFQTGHRTGHPHSSSMDTP